MPEQIKRIRMKDAAGVTVHPETDSEVVRDGDSTVAARLEALSAAFAGATSEDAGAKGLVPAPAASETVKVLCSDGTWKTLAELGATAG